MVCGFSRRPVAKACTQPTQPAFLTECLLRAANGSHLSCFSQIVLLNVVQLRSRRLIREKSNI